MKNQENKIKQEKYRVRFSDCAGMVSFAVAAQDSECSVTLSYANTAVDGKSVLCVCSMPIGEPVTCTVTGSAAHIGALLPSVKEFLLEDSVRENAGFKKFTPACFQKRRSKF